MAGKATVTLTSPINTPSVPNNDYSSVDIENQHQQVNTLNRPEWWPPSLIKIKILLTFGVITCTGICIIPGLVLEKHIPTGGGFIIFLIGMLIFYGSGILLTVVAKNANETPRSFLFFKILLVVFLFGSVFGPSVLYIGTYARHLAYRVCGGVLLAAYLGALSCYIGRW